MVEISKVLIVESIIGFGKDIKSTIRATNRAHKVHDDVQGMLKLNYLVDSGFAYALEVGKEKRDDLVRELKRLRAEYADVYNNLHRKRCALLDYSFETTF